MQLFLTNLYNLLLDVILAISASTTTTTVETTTMQLTTTSTKTTTSPATTTKCSTQLGGNQIWLEFGYNFSFSGYFKFGINSNEKISLYKNDLYN